MAKVGNITFTPDELSTTFQTYRKELIVMPMLAMNEALQHMSVRTGIRYRETVTEMSGKFELGNYKKDKKVPETSALTDVSLKLSSEIASSRLILMRFINLYGAQTSQRVKDLKTFRLFCRYART